ncbi:hypothetical protein TIFTF001_048305 [Ficus carica]|uniref:Uncharacterized protein n=1 Tax=Ficus carica TaxID=3494 RepID=A0AA87ZV93_FICCA|nr:hypothetical protein TIFTF001_048305 [Ficus carica]
MVRPLWRRRRCRHPRSSDVYSKLQMVEDLGLNLNCDLGVEALEGVRRRRECRFEVGEDEDCRIIGSVVAKELADGDRVREVPGV